MLGFNVCAADSVEEATFLRSSSLQSFLNLRKGTPGQLPPPLENFEESMAPQDEATKPPSQGLTIQVNSSRRQESAT
jgi:hypothetical protein